jgi:ribosomal protein S18 acetylase RimI-like enzyme
MQISEAQIEETQSLRDLLEFTFRDTYGHQNSPEEIEKHVAKNFSFQLILAELQDENFQYFVVKEGLEIVAFCKLVKNHTLEGISKRTVEIERFYVHPKLKGKGLGRKLMDYCFNWAEAAGFELVWLGVWERNFDAIAFYQKMGFQQFGTHVFVLGDDAQTDYVLTKELLVHHK